MSLDQFLQDPSKIGVIGLLAVAIAAFLRGWVVTATQHQFMIAQYNVLIEQYKSRLDDVTREKEEFKQMVLRTVDTADRALKAAEKVAAENIVTTRKK